MSETAPRISVCTPTYQGCDRLSTTAEVTLAAMGPADEWIVAVDGSTDGTAEYLARLAADDERVRVLVSERNEGRTAALNRACRAARGEIVLRLDDDILVGDDFFELHAAAHERAEGPVGVVQPIVDAFEQEAPRDRMWRAFVRRNAASDLARFTRSEESVPACMWGPVCSCRRSSGERLGWYDEDFNAYGWEDIEFAYRLQAEGARLVLVAEAEVRHLVHWTTFAAKLRRGFEAGARMAVFASKHGAAAVLEALGHDPEARLEPRVTDAHRRADRRDALTGAATAGERVLGVLGWRRAYDGWVARWLSWAYAAGWRDESVALGLPVIPVPTTWPRGVRRDWRAVWERLADVLRSSEDGAAWSVARSVALRLMEQDVLPPARRLREAAGAVRAASRYRGAMRRRRVSPLPVVDVVVAVEADTPSTRDLPLALADRFAEAGFAVAVAVPDDRIAAAVRGTGAAHPIITLTAVGAGPSTPHGRGGRNAVRALTSAAGLGLSLPARVQCEAEAEAGEALARMAECALDALRPRAVVSVTEYFPFGAALADAARRAGTPFVTAQHGNVNAMYAPFRADRYWVFSRPALDAMAALDGDAARLRLIAPVRAKEAGRARERDRGAMGVADDALVVAVFSQTHGVEFSAATHFDLAGQLLGLMRQESRVHIVIKRHPAERESAYEALAATHDRVTMSPPGITASELAAQSDLAVALNSTALTDAMAEGCPAIEVLCGGSLVAQPAAVVRVGMQDVCRSAVRVLTDARSRAEVLDAQRRSLAEPPDAMDVAEALDELAGKAAARA